MVSVFLLFASEWEKEAAEEKMGSGRGKDGKRQRKRYICQPEIQHI